MVFLALIPALLTIVALLFIMVKATNKSDAGEDDFNMDDDHMEIIRVAVYEDKAYWVHDNVFYESEVTREPDFDTARPIDVTALSSKDLNELFSVLDELEKKKERD